MLYLYGFNYAVSPGYACMGLVILVASKWWLREGFFVQVGKFAHKYTYAYL